MSRNDDLPLYQSHKIVGAALIAGVFGRDDGTFSLTFADERISPRDVTGEYVEKHKPEAGGYFVEYEDGYQSWSPAKAFEDGYTPLAGVGMSVAGAARVAHEANRAYCISIGDHSQPSWEEAPDWQRESCINGVLAVRQLVMSGRIATPEASHANWMQHKIACGWTHGPAKDPEEKTHPCLVPWDELPAEQKAKDYIFRAVVTAMIQGA